MRQVQPMRLRVADAISTASSEVRRVLRGAVSALTMSVTGLKESRRQFLRITGKREPPLWLELLWLRDRPIRHTLGPLSCALRRAAATPSPAPVSNRSVDGSGTTAGLGMLNVASWTRYTPSGITSTSGPNSAKANSPPGHVRSVGWCRGSRRGQTALP
jgi:hypothetical protein